MKQQNHTPDSHALFPLSSNQQNIWNLERSLSGTSANCISTTIRIRGRINFLLLQKALDLVLEHDPGLRTRIVLQDGVPMQYHAEYRQQDFPLLDFSLTDEEGITHWEQTLTREPIHLLEGPLYRFVMFRTGENTAGLLVKTHHIISDGWSQVMLCNRIGQTYLNLLGEKPHGLEEFPSYRLHLQEEEAYADSPACAKDERFWKGVLENAGEAAVIKSVKSAVVSPVGRRCSFKLPQTLNHAIYSFCMKHRVAPFSVLYMALAIYLRRMGNSKRFVIGVPVFNRTNFTYKQTTGMFVSTLPFSCEVDDELSLEQFNDRLAENWFEMLRHQRLPFGRINELREETSPLFHIVLSYQDSKILETPDASVEFSGRWHYSGYQMEHLCLHLTNLEDNRKYSLDYDYLTQVFSDKEIRELHGCLCNILTQTLAAPETPIHRLPLLGAEEYETLVYNFNETRTPLRETNLFRLLQGVAEEHPQRVAVICGGRRTTYSSLMEQAGRIAAALPAEKGLAALMLPRTPTLYAAIAGVLQAGSAWVILPPTLPRGRVEEILTQSGASCILACGETMEAASGFGLPVIDAENLPLAAAVTAEVSPDDPAYVVYTSGSTGAPKGVEISQRNLANFAHAMKPLYAKGAVLSVSNTAFDAFIIESACALLCGRTVVLPRDEELEQPRALADLIRGYGVGFISLTPSRLAAFLRDSRFRAAMRGMESVLCGGERFPTELLDQLQLICKARIYNQYGPSEATVGVSYSQLNGAKTITAGKPMENCRLYVLDDHMHPLPAGTYGDLYIGGTCVGRGYRNAPQLTEQSFMPSPFDLGDTLYKTGDLACWTPEGEIIISGRRDSQIKLRGLRVEPQEVSSRLAGYPGVISAAAKVCLYSGQPVLVAYYTSEKPLSEAALLSHLAGYLPHYMIPSRILRLEAMPINANGKVDEKLLPLPQLEETANIPANGLESAILDIFRTVLEDDSLHCGSDYFMHGGNSLNAMETVGLLEERTGIRLRIADLYACRTPHRLGEFLQDEDLGVSHSTIEPAPVLEEYPASTMQQSIYVQSMTDPTGIAYNMPGVFVLPEGTDCEALTAALRRLIALDDSFRMGFVPRGGSIVAKPAKRVRLDVDYLEAADLQTACEKFIRPFDLAKAPLLRAALWRRPQDDRTLLLMDSHHIIGDGLSTPVLLARLDALCRGEEPAVPLTYKDYAWAQANRETAAAAESQDFWKKTLLPLPEAPELPTDFARALTFDFRGDIHSHALSQQLSEKLDAYCREKGLTPFMLFFAAYGLQLCRLCGRESILIGTPVANRLQPELQQVCGPFLNTLPLPMKATGALSDCLAQLKTAAAGMLDHQDVTLEDLLNLLNLPRIPGENPLYQVLFSMRPLDAAAFTLGEKPLECLPVPTGTAKLELSLEVAKTAGCYSLNFEYATSLFREDTVACIARGCEAMLQSILAADDDAEVSGLNAVSARDRLMLWDKPNRTHVPYLNIPVHKLIEEYALLTPDAPAVVWHDQTVTFGQLDERACRLAALLQSKGVKRGDRVGLCVSRSPEMLACMLGILKAGAAYVPFLPSYPMQRVEYMMETAAVSALLWDEAAAGTFAGIRLGCPVVSTGEACAADYLPVEVDGADPIYVLFTSGSTGKPKGVQLPHRAISNLLEAMKGIMDGHGPMLCATNITFDIFTTESLLTLAQGFCIALADEEEMLLPWKLADLIFRHDVDMAQFTPSRLQLCLGNSAFAKAAAQIDMVILVGEAVSPGLVNSWHKASAGRFVNMYGPTEAAVYVTAGELTPDRPVTIGRPLGNCRIYVLDEQRRPVPPTGRGELYLAGECLADGYISRPDLTEKVFVDDPFFPGERMYRTGDLGRLGADGILECFGRCDSQIKLNGNRVELDEINAALTASGAALAATVPVTHADGSTSLCSFVTPSGIAPEELKQALGSLLPPYMVPAEIRPMPELPSNASGKIDLPELKRMAAESAPQPVVTRAAAQPKPEAVPMPAPEPEPAPAAEPVPAPEPEPAPEPVTLPRPQPTPAAAGSIGEEELLAIWQETLGGGPLQADLSFFQQGGSSLAALNILSQYFNRGITMTLTEFYQNPTARQQAALLAGGQPSAPEAAAEEPLEALPEPEYEPEYEALPEPTALAEPERYPARVPMLENHPARFSRVLLTGATGFLGAHLLRALIDRGVADIWCLVRGGSEERLEEALTYYFGPRWVKAHRKAVHTVAGDLSLDRFGMDDAAYRLLMSVVDMVYHAAADVRHYVSDDSSYQVNALGTARVVRFCLDGDIPLRHVSTASICGDRLAPPAQAAIYSEVDFDIGQNWRDNLYIKTKFLAEWGVYRAMEEGLDARVFRVGRLVGRSTDGKFQPNGGENAFALLLNGLQQVGALPQSLAAMPVEITPVDLCAQSILALEQGPLTTWHITQPQPMGLQQLTAALMPDLPVVSDAEFEALLNRKAKKAPQTVGQLVEQWNRLKNFVPRIVLSSTETHRYLEALKGGWPEFSAEMVLKNLLNEPSARKE